MPIYEYRCDKGHTFEVMQSMSDDPLSSCTVCSAPVQKVLYAPAVHFKGSGFYTTDYGKKSNGASASSEAKKEKSSDSTGSDSAGSSSSSTGSSSKKADSGGSSASSTSA